MLVKSKISAMEIVKNGNSAKSFFCNNFKNPTGERSTCLNQNVEISGQKTSIRFTRIKHFILNILFFASKLSFLAPSKNKYSKKMF